MTDFLTILVLLCTAVFFGVTTLFWMWRAIVWKRKCKVAAQDGDTVFDPFLGSGTTRLAASNLGLDFVGCEISTVYFNAQEERFARHIAQPKLFVPEPVVEQGVLI